MSTPSQDLVTVAALGEFRVFGHCVPSRLDATVIMDELRPLLPACCQRDKISVREPEALIHPDNLAWHHDGGGTAGSVRHMVVWASEMPTQIQRSDGTEFQGDPFDLVWFNNDVAKHRQPDGTNPSTRWFASVRCSGE